MIVKTLGSQKGSIAAAEEGAEGRGGERTHKLLVVIILV